MLQSIIPSYVYSQYQDDDDIVAFARAYNDLAQQYVNTALQLGLPLYPNLTGNFLDWVGVGLYGYARPTLPSGMAKTTGPYNTFGFNQWGYDKIDTFGPANYYLTSDDIYIRCINWHFYKGDGKNFDIEWLKRRVARFLWGPGASPPNSGIVFNGWDFDVAHEYQISVTFGTNHQVDINILNGEPTHIKGAVFNGMQFNKVPYNKLTSIFVPQSIPALAPVLKAAIDSGVLELPFQFTYVVNY